tara:strand:+ start:220 stop:447 length:228 start_codon:yes stop_codon:yes gene_type:complete
MGKDANKKRAKRQRRYIFHNDSSAEDTRIHLVYYYKNEEIVLASDGPFFKESDAVNKMKEHLLKGRCAWMVAYNG